MEFSKELLTQKGNLKAKVAADFKAQALAKMDLPLEDTPNGTHAMVIGTDEDGREFYLTVSVTVGTADPFVKVAKKAKAKPEAEALDIPEVFG